MRELLSTFYDFWGFNEFLVEMYKTISEEDTYYFYLHKSLFSNESYNEFKARIEANRKSSIKSDEEILKDVKEIIDEFNSKTK